MSGFADLGGGIVSGSWMLKLRTMSLPEAGIAVGNPAERLLSLDVFRGATIAAMILVNDAGDEASAYAALRHSTWNGWTPTDLVFPFFLFIVGAAMAFSFRSRLARGESRRKLFAHALWRGFLLFALGVLLNGVSNHYQLASWRVYGVLQRIAVCYVIAAALQLWAGWRDQATVVVVCLVGYWILIRYIPVPGFGIPGRDIPLLDPDKNIAAWLDRKLLLGHLFECSRDPEGVLSTIPAIATSLLGLLTGKWMASTRSAGAKARGMMLFGIAEVASGEGWNQWFPINKKLWTSSFVLLTAGLAMVVLALGYWLFDGKGKRKGTLPFLVFGMNSIAAYVLSEVVAAALLSVSWQAGSERISLQEFVYGHWFVPLASPANASLLYAFAYVLTCWMVMFAMYRKRIFLKI